MSIRDGLGNRRSNDIGTPTIQPAAPHASAPRATRDVTRERIGTTIVYTALAGDAAIACLKFWAAHRTGSSAMLSEGIHSSIDTLTELLLLYGLAAARRPPTAKHPIGFGREVFFWNFIVALTILGLGAGAALLDGARQVIRPEPITSPYINYVTLGAAFLVELLTVVVTSRSTHRTKRRRNTVRHLRLNRDATALTIFLSGISGIFGLAIAASGTWLSVRYDDPVFDGLGSLTIALALAVTAVFLAWTSKTLIIGVPTTTTRIASILRIAANHPAVLRANGATTVHLAPDQILVVLSIAFLPECRTPDIEDAIADLNVTILTIHPKVFIFTVKPESIPVYDSRVRVRGW